MNILHKICPVCKAMIRIKYQPNIEKLNIRCSQCGKVSPFFMFLSANNNDSADSKQTLYPGPNNIADHLETGNVKTEISIDGNAQQGSPSNDPRKQMYGEFFNPITTKLAYIKVSTSNQLLPLKMGRNIIGRQSESSKANIQISEPGTTFISREHLYLDVHQTDDGKFQYIISLYKNGVNKTYLKDTLIMHDDELMMEINDSIRFSNNITLTLVELDEDNTNIYE